MAFETPHPLLIELGPWSVSKIDTLAQCPKKFQFNYVHKIKIERPVGKALLVGQAVHKVLQYAITGRNLDASFEFAISECKLTSEEIDEVNGYRPAITSFLLKYKHYLQKYDIRESITEKQYAIALDGTPSKFFDNAVTFIRGVVDLAMFTRVQPHLIVIDHKTGKYRDFSHYDVQFDFYRLLLRAAYPNITGIVTGIHRVTDANIQTSPLIGVSDIEPLFNNVVNHMNWVAENITDLEEKKTGWWCRFCDYADRCQEG